MPAILTYKGYIGKVELDEEANELFGRVINSRDVITFVGRTVQDAKRALRVSVDAHLEFCADRGIEPGKPYSGKILLRVAPQVHAALVARAAGEGLSLNEFLKSVLERSVETRRSTKAATKSKKRRAA